MRFMKASAEHQGLTPEARGVRLVESVSVSVSESEAEIPSLTDKGSEGAPPGSGELRDGT